MPSLPSPEPTVSCFDDLDFFKDFENEFPAIVYNDAQTSKSDSLTEPILNPQHIDEFDLNIETSLSKYDEEEQNVLYFNDLFPFDIIHPDDLKSEKDNDDNEIDKIQSSGGISSAGDFLGAAPSYTSIRDSILRLCHRLIACSIAGRSQAPKKVTVTNLFYLRGMEVGSVNVPYLLARYLRLFAVWRKSEALISGGQFVARLAEHFGLLTEERLQGLTVAMGPERQPNAMVGAPRVAQDAPVMDEGGQTDPAPVQAPPPPLAAARTMLQRMARLEEDVHEIRRALAEQREVIGAMARDFSRFTRRVRHRTGETSTSTAQQNQQQPDP
ncbi:hypothetical protein Tco_1106131 [Tanacetum coccineum]